MVKPTPMPTRPTGRGWAYLGIALGGAVSIAANVAHSYVPPPDAAPGWSPHLGAVVGAVFWPLALFVAVEIFARVAWPAMRRWALLRWCGLLPVALVAAVVSYRHLSGLLTFYSEDNLTAHLGPLAVDGLMVMATGALIATGAHRVAMAAMPVPVTDPADTAAPDTAAPDPAPATPVPVRPRSPRRAPAAAQVAKAAAKMPDATVAQLATKTGLSERTVRRHLPPADVVGGAGQSPASTGPVPAGTRVNGVTVAA